VLRLSDNSGCPLDEPGLDGDLVEEALPQPITLRNAIKAVADTRTKAERTSTFRAPSRLGQGKRLGKLFIFFDAVRFFLRMVPGRAWSNLLARSASKGRSRSCTETSNIVQVRAGGVVGNSTDAERGLSDRSLRDREATKSANWNSAVSESHFPQRLAAVLSRTKLCYWLRPFPSGALRLPSFCKGGQRN